MAVMIPDKWSQLKLPTIGKPDAAEQERLLKLFWNRAELKKELQGLDDQLHNLRNKLKQQENANSRLQQQLEQLEMLLGSPERGFDALVHFGLKSLWRACREQLERFASDLKRDRQDAQRKQQLAELETFFRRGREDGGSFEAGIGLALRRLLASPKFIFRLEPDPPSVAPGAAYALSDRAIASRLAFFLWSSIPDDELLDLADAGRLGDPDVLDAQVRRMLADPKAQALVDNFLGQWLQLRNLENKQPNSHAFPDFDDNLRHALRREVELFFNAVVREDRSVLDLMTADDTFVNERLALHYGIPHVYGSHFRRVTLADESRHGLLGKGALLMVTSHPHRTSPVLRGKWVLENVLGTPPPPPPDAVPPFEEETAPDRPLSVRARMEQHRRNPACAGCHRMIDPVGLALENFDAVGAWRTRDGGTRGTAVDATGQLVDGTSIDGVNALRDALMRDPEVFVGTLVEKMLVYALGRGLTAADQPAVRAVVRGSAPERYRFSSIVTGIVRSVPFRMRTASPAPAGETPARGATVTRE
jgi:hypothetical protein